MLKKWIILTLFFSIVSICDAHHNAAVKEYITDISFDKKKLIEETSVLIKINDKESSWVTDIAIPYHIEDKIKIIEASILDENMNLIRLINKKEIKTLKNTSIGNYDDSYLIKSFNLKWNTYPYHIRYKYQIIKSDYLFVCNWTPYIKPQIETQKAALNLYLPKNLEYNKHISAHFKLTHNSINGTTKQLSWNAEGLNAIFDEKHPPATYDLLARIIISPFNFYYGTKGKQESWKEYGQWRYKTNKQKNNIPESEIKYLKKLIENISSDYEKLKMIYEYFQKSTRFIESIYESNKLKPTSIKKITELKYGDSKSLSYYLKSILHKLGYKAYFTEIIAGCNTQEVIEEIPGQQFNQALLCLPLNNDTIWMDCTSSSYPFNYIGFESRNKIALIIKDKASALIKTPSIHIEELEENVKIEIDFKDYNAGTAKFDYEFNGVMYDKLLKLYKETRVHDQRTVIENLLPVKNYEIVDWELYQNYPESKSINLKVELKVKNQLNIIGSNIIIPPIQIFDDRFESPDQRKHSVKISRALNKKLSIEYSLKDLKNFSIQLPENRLLKSKYGQYKLDFIIKSGKIILKKEFQLYQNDFKLEEYHEFYNFVNSILTIEESSSIRLKLK